MDNTFSLNLSQVPMELKLIIEILKSEDIDKEQYNLIELLKDTKWELFLDLAMHHRVYPLLYSKLTKMDKNLVPSYVLQTITQTYVFNTYQMLQFSGEMEEISRLFNKNDIRLLCLKGPVIGVDLYGDVSLRTSGDLDFLISIDDLVKAEELLLNIGYEKDDYIKTVLNDWKWRHHHITYIHPEKKMKIEIHWRLNPGPGKEPNFSDLWKRKRKSSLTSYPIYYLGREDLFLFLVSHGARHGWSRLRWLLDINQISGQEVNWDHLTILLKKFNFFDVGGQALILSSELFNTPIIKEMKILINNNRAIKLAQAAIFYLERMVNLHNDPVPTEIARYHKTHLFSLMSKKQRLVFITSFMYPYPEDAETLPLPNKIHFLYFLLRPFLWAWRKAKYRTVI
ncbi:nucleotidyltransferase family protein [Bacillus sp. ISL-18]|uniref:nucleotidyltransferase domain-containing protein n=1 Tax=Bacillus sp. ISL-18 TaxID=2819118 RepID=UPI001BEA81EE|nr:nucleotidyltransferase family protein [Bacillus sp. ISL-18]MBT2657074.1 nucleotidyltransferase family protein [Bacillus sp. ISL-18]